MRLIQTTTVIWFLLIIYFIYYGLCENCTADVCSTTVSSLSFRSTNNGNRTTTTTTTTTTTPDLSPLSKHDFYSRFVSEHIFIDKTAMIKAYLRYNLSSVILIRRPRKWCKSMNLDMIRRFLEIELDPITGEPFLSEDERINRKLFVGGTIRLKNKPIKLRKLYITQFGYTMSLQGTFPVIYLDFERITGIFNIYQEIQYYLKKTVKRLFTDRPYLKRYLNDDNDDNILNESDRKRLNAYMSEDFGLLELKESLRFLSKTLFLHHKRKVHVLIDNYDVPISRLFFNLTERYRKEAVDNNRSSSESTIYRKVVESEDFRRTVSLFGEILERCLQNNEAVLEKALITGVLRFAEGDPFVNFTDINDYTLLDKEFSEFYGFSQDELDDILDEMSFLHTRDEIREWYGGYRYGNTDTASLYNPWSLIQCLEYSGRLSNYWISQNHMGIVEFALSKNADKLRDLTDGKCIRINVGKRLKLINGIRQDDVFGILLFAGYLTAKNVTRLDDGNYTCQLSVPNKEVLNALREKLNEK